MCIVPLAVASSLRADNDSLLVATCLPGTDPAGAWVQEDSVQVYRQKQLYSLIDGGAALYEEYGFTAAAATVYRMRSGGFWSAEVYEMKNQDAAFGMFSSITGGIIDTSTHTDAFRFTGDYYTCVCRGTYIIALTAQDPATWDSSAAHVLLGRTIVALPASVSKPVPVSILESALGPCSSVVYVRGPLGLQNHAPAWYLRVLPVKEAGIGECGAVRTFLARCASDSEAAAAAGRLAGANGVIVSAGNGHDLSGSVQSGDGEGMPLAIGTEKDWLIVVSGGSGDSCLRSLEAVRTALRTGESGKNE